MTFAVAGMILSGISAVAQIQAGRQQARAYEAQARQEELKGKQAELQYRQQGLEVLRRTRQNMSTVTARAAAGGLNPYTGSPQSLKNYASATGTEEFYLARENAQLALITGDINAQQNRMAASQARRQGFISAVGTLGSAALTMGSIGGPTSNVGTSFGGPMISGQTATALPTGYGTMGAAVPSNLPAFPR